MPFECSKATLRSELASCNSSQLSFGRTVLRTRCELLVLMPLVPPGCLWLRPLESLPLASRCRKCLSEGTEEHIHPIPVSIFEQSMMWATQTVMERKQGSYSSETGRKEYSQGKSVIPLNLFTYGIRTMVMMEATEANDRRPNACSLACLFICVFHRMIAGTTTKARSVKIVETVAVWPMITNVSTGAHVALPASTSIGFQIAFTGSQYSRVPTKVMKNDAQVTAKRQYTVMRNFILVEAIRMIVIQMEDLTVARAKTYVRIQIT
jgi:hypothetical protein